MKTPVLIWDPSNHNALFSNECPYKQQYTITSYAQHFFQETYKEVQVRLGIMKLFRIMIVSFYFSMSFHKLDMFVAGELAIMMSSGGPEMFPILRSRKYLYIYFFRNRTVLQRFKLFVSQV